MKAVVGVGVLCLLVAAWTAPPTRAATGIDATPWPPAIVRVAALGRTFAAADVSWLKTVQVIGDGEQAAQRWPALDEWLNLVTGLDPSFEEPYYLGATLLVTDPERAVDVDRLLARGEGAFPTVFSLPMLRGFLAQFGTLDAPRAAAHYERASRLPGAPAHLGGLARRLAKETDDCSSALADLAQFAQLANRAQAEALVEQRAVIYEHCLKGVIERAATRFRFNTGAHATIDDVEREIGPVPHPPGRCWVVASDRARLEPCPAPSPAEGQP